jgi:hypothetical protein
METEVISRFCNISNLAEHLLISDRCIELLIVSYFSVVKREMIDMVPKAITLTLINFAKENMQRVLLEHLYSESIHPVLPRHRLILCSFQNLKFLKSY